jgi:hypothetical protein
MPTTYEPIATTTLTTSATEVEFTSISGSYTDLVFVVQTKGTAQANTLLRVGNGSLDTGSNYSETFLSGNGSAASSARETNQTYYYFTYASYHQSNTFNTSIHHFMNYSNTTTNKTILSRSNNPAIGTDAVVGLWRSTSAINIIRIYPANNSFDTGSTFTLYGIKAA